MKPHHRKQKTDRLVSLVAHGMENQDRLRQFGHELMGDFRESAVGMMENFQESVDSSEQFWNSVWSEMRAGMQNGVQKMRDGMENGAQKMRDGMESGTQKALTGVQWMREDVQTTAEEMREDAKEFKRDIKRAAQELKKKKRSR